MEQTAKHEVRWTNQNDESASIRRKRANEEVEKNEEKRTLKMTKKAKGIAHLTFQDIHIRQWQ